MRVRALTPKEVDEAAALLRTCGMEPTQLPGVMYCIGSPIVACGGMLWMDHGSAGWLSSVAVARSHRRQGLGSKIVQALVQHAEKALVRELWLETFVWNVRFYVPNGFVHVPVARVPPHVKEWRDNPKTCFLYRELEAVC